MVVIKNDPALSIAFRKPEMKEFLKDLLDSLEDPYTLKEFLKDGYMKFYQEQLDQLAKSFTIKKADPKEQGAYLEVERCIDGITFKVNQEVLDKISGRKHPIGKMYEDDRGLHVQLKVDGMGTITWRNLSEIRPVVGIDYLKGKN